MGPPETIWVPEEYQHAPRAPPSNGPPPAQLSMPNIAQPMANLPVVVDPKEEELNKVKEDLKMLTNKFDKVKISGNYMDYTHKSPYPKPRLPEKFKIANIEKFGGSWPPIVHLRSYHHSMTLLGASEEVMAQLF